MLAMLTENEDLTDHLQVEPQVQKLFDYIRERGTIIAIQQYDKKLLIHGDVSKVVAESIRIGKSLWTVCCEKAAPLHTGLLQRQVAMSI